MVESVRCGKYIVTLALERGDVEVTRGLERYGASGIIGISQNAQFRSPLLDSEEYADAEITSFPPRYEWNDNVNGSSAHRDVPILTLLIEYDTQDLQGGYENDNGRLLLVFSPEERQADIAYRKLRDFFESQEAVDGFLEGENPLVRFLSKLTV